MRFCSPHPCAFDEHQPVEVQERICQQRFRAQRFELLRSIMPSGEIGRRTRRAAATVVSTCVSRRKNAGPLG